MRLLEGLLYEFTSLAETLYPTGTAAFGFLSAQSTGTAACSTIKVAAHVWWASSSKPPLLGESERNPAKALALSPPHRKTAARGL